MIEAWLSGGVLVVGFLLLGLAFLVRTIALREVDDARYGLDFGTHRPVDVQAAWRRYERAGGRLGPLGIVLVCVDCLWIFVRFFWMGS